MWKYMFAFFNMKQSRLRKDRVRVFSVLCFITKHSWSSSLHNFAFLKWKQYLHMHSYLQARVCAYLFCGRQYKLYFSQKREHTLFVNLQIFFSLVSGQITSGYLLFFMARKCGQLGHFIRHSPFQIPAETVRDDDFESSGKAVTHQSASNCLW